MKFQKKIFLSTLLFTGVLTMMNFSHHEVKATPNLPQQIVKSVDMERFMGTWYEIARFPNFFQSNEAIGGSDTYEKLANGEYRVTYRWQEKSFDQPEKTMQGKIWIADPEIMGKMKVEFFWPFSADYWLIDLDNDYNYLVVGYPDRSMLWILSKTKTLSQEDYLGILERLKKQDYDISKLIRVPQKITGGSKG